MPSSLPSIPDTIGRYEVTRILGQGAMGRVLLARDPVLNRDVAIKVLRDDLGLPPEVVAGMQHELQRVARDPDAVFWYSFVQARARVG